MGYLAFTTVAENIQPAIPVSPALLLKGRGEGTESSEKSGWRGPERAQACLTARRAREGSTPSVFAAYGVHSRQFMNNAG